MRFLAVLACLSLGGCSSQVYDLPPPMHAPEVSVAIDGAKKAANEAKLVGPVEVSAVREAYPLGPGPYILCIRGTNSQTPARTYAVFFENGAYVATRTSLIIDQCETQTFAPLGTGPFTVAVKPPPS